MFTFNVLKFLSYIFQYFHNNSQRFTNPSGCLSTALHAVFPVLMRERYYCVCLHMLSVDVLTHDVDLYKTASH